MKHLFSLLLCLLPLTLEAQDRQDYFGGWVAEHDEGKEIFYVVIRDDGIRGFYCDACTHPDNLAFIDDGKLAASGLTFRLSHVSGQETVTAVREGDALLVTRGARAPVRFVRETPPATPAPVNRRPNFPVPMGKTVMPGEAEPISPATIAGIWLWGTGPGKQYFLFREYQGSLRGMVCGPCDSVNAMAPLEHFSFDDTVMHFQIIHEDNGRNVQLHGPYSRFTDAVLSRNELHISAHNSFNPPEAAPIEMTLLGPVDRVSP
ncbi:MAG: hypothetical protein ACO3R5_14095 [Pseudohongiellaceae bacterium]